MQAGISGGGHTENAPGKNDARIMNYALQGRDREREPSEPQRPVPQLVNGLGDWPRAEVIGCRLEYNPSCRQQRRREGDDLYRRPAPGPLAKEWHWSAPAERKILDLRDQAQSIAKAPRSQPITICRVFFEEHALDGRHPRTYTIRD